MPQVESQNPWYERQKPEKDDQREPCKRDRDRILYSSAFRRLSAVTQVVAPTESHFVHNRMTHSLEVAQIARGIAENLADSEPSEKIDEHGGLDVDAVEAAALAHDLGHPPFGHVAEKELDRLVRVQLHVFDGYEGNAQSFRIVTKLELRRAGFRGLNLTRTTLNAILKYPWYRHRHGKGLDKWGAYRYTENEAFEFAREVQDGVKLQKEAQKKYDPEPSHSHRSLEAAIMTWADDIAYAVHDMEDFYRMGQIPLERFAAEDQGEIQRFFDGIEERRTASGKTLEDAEWNWDAKKTAFEQFCKFLPVKERFSGTRDQRLHLQSVTATKIGEYLRATVLANDPARPLKMRSDHLEHEMEMLKELTWHYVIKRQALATQQYGYRTVIRGLFDAYMDAINSHERDWSILPPRWRTELVELKKDFDEIPLELRIRTTADAVSSLTDGEAIRLYQRFSGVLPGSMRDLLAH